MELNYDPSDLKGSALAEKARADRSDAAAAEWESDTKWLMSGRRGRRVAHRILESAGIFRSTFQTNGLLMAHGEGRRSVGLELLQAINNVCPDAYVLMMSEQQETEDV